MADLNLQIKTKIVTLRNAAGQPQLDSTSLFVSDLPTERAADADWAADKDTNTALKKVLP